MCLPIAVDYPDRVLATGEHAGFQWVVTHNNMGYRCGYVRVPLGHPWHGKDCDVIGVEVHGGLTFAGPDKTCDGAGSDDGYWFGFDCAHAWDVPDPELPNSLAGKWPPALFAAAFGDEVRTQEYVEEECRHLCAQAAVARKQLAANGK